MKTKLVLLLLLISLSSFDSVSHTIRFEEQEYRLPDKVDHLLFYIQRTINSNTIVYELNTDSDGELIEHNPIKVHWVKYEEDGKMDGLTYIQRKLAYGVKTKVIDKKKMVFSVEFVSYGKRKLYLKKSEIDNRYHVYGYINNKLCIVSNIFVNITGGTFWLPKVAHVELYGNHPSSKMAEKETIIP